MPSPLAPNINVRPFLKLMCKPGLSNSSPGYNPKFVILRFLKIGKLIIYSVCATCAEIARMAYNTDGIVFFSGLIVVFVIYTYSKL